MDKNWDAFDPFFIGNVKAGGTPSLEKGLREANEPEVSPGFFAVGETGSKLVEQLQ